jgi:peptidoglycan hydrolase-like protein with peptidoglycan-binding domain
MAEFEHNSEKFGYISCDDLEGVQNALIKLGYEPGKADGIDGPKTQGAVRAFQTDVSIGVDGIAGPETKAALVSQLEAQAAIPAEATS